MMNLYLHFPFCQQKCFYCDFVSFSNQKHLIDQYCHNLLRETDFYGQKFQGAQIDTIYLGGGTPSLIEPTHLKQILQNIRQSFHVKDGAEISIETNPDSLSREKLQAYRQIGINRLSMGVQAWQNELLKLIGRTYQIETVTQAYQLAREAGFTNINLDLIFALPSQTMTQWQESLKHTIKLQPEHISCYSLEWDNQSVFARQLQNGKLQTVSDQLDRQMYHLACQKLEQADYRQYEISNFSKAGFACQHNLDFWHGQDYLGLGVAAVSRIDKETWQNTRNIKKYCQTGGLQIIDKSKQNKTEQIAAIIMLELRTNEGIDKNRLKRQYDFDLDHAKKKEIAWLEAEGLISNSANTLRATAKGRDVLEQIISNLAIT